jgi:NDP-sugar pyrophosphorylase family protein
MLNILVPIAGDSVFFKEENTLFPKPMYDVDGKMMIERVVANLAQIKGDTRFIFVVNEKDCAQHYLDNVLNLLTENTCEVIKVSGKTKGAVCTCLLAIEYINSTDKLIICNGDQVIDDDLSEILKQFEDEEADAGVICFESIHPRWSFVRLDDEGIVIETSEKRPISKNAIAGFYYFKEGKSFISMAQRSIEKDRQINNSYYIAPTLNELILEGKKISLFQLQDGSYHSFYSPEMVSKYSKKIEGAIALN